MDIKAIKSEKDYNQALTRLETIFHAEMDTPEGDEAEVLSILIEKYEDGHYPIGMPDPIEAIKFRMEQLGMKQKDLAEVVGFTSRVSEILLAGKASCQQWLIHIINGTKPKFRFQGLN